MIYKFVSSWEPKKCPHKYNISWYYYIVGTFGLHTHTHSFSHAVPHSCQLQSDIRIQSRLAPSRVSLSLSVSRLHYHVLCNVKQRSEEETWCGHINLIPLRCRLSYLNARFVKLFNFSKDVLKTTSNPQDSNPSVNILWMQKLRVYKKQIHQGVSISLLSKIRLHNRAVIRP